MPIPSLEQANSQPCTQVLKLLADRIRAERRRLNLNQKQFSLRCGIPLRTYKRLELGECDSMSAFIRVFQGFERAAALEMLFPPMQLERGPRGLQKSMESIRQKLEARVVKGEGILPEGWDGSSQ